MYQDVYIRSDTYIDRRIARFKQIIKEMGLEPGEIDISFKDKDMPYISNSTMRKYASERGYTLYERPGPERVAESWVSDTTEDDEVDWDAVVIFIPRDGLDEAEINRSGLVWQMIEAMSEDTAESRLRVFLELNEMEMANVTHMNTPLLSRGGTRCSHCVSNPNLCRAA